MTETGGKHELWSRPARTQILSTALRKITAGGREGGSEGASRQEERKEERTYRENPNDLFNLPVLCFLICKMG